MPDTRRYTEAQKRSAKKWDAANLDRLSVAAPKGSKERWKISAEKRGQSLNQFIVESVETAINAPERPQEVQSATAVQSTPQTHKTTQSASKEAQEGVPLHTLEQRARRILYKYNAKLRKQKDGSYIIEWEGSNQNFKTFEELVRFLDGLNKEGDPT